MSTTQVVDERIKLAYDASKRKRSHLNQWQSYLVFLIRKKMCLRVAFILLLASCAGKERDRIISVREEAHHILDLGSGAPPIIFIAGLGDDLQTFSKVQPAISTFTRTLSYDRPGLGTTPVRSRNRSLDTLAFELHQILEHEDVRAPYILVAHSYGGHIARYFAHIYPESVMGMVLLDPSTEFMDDEIRKSKTASEVKSYDSLYEHGRDPAWSEGVHLEADYFRSSTSTMKDIKFSKGMRVTVITALNTPESSHSFLSGVNELKLKLHKRFKEEAPHIRHVMSRSSGHYIHVDDPELVINEIKKIAR